MLAARQGTLSNCLKMLATATIEQLKLGNYYLHDYFYRISNDKTKNSDR